MVLKMEITVCAIVAQQQIQSESVQVLRIQSECGKMRTRKTPNTDTFHAVRKSV